MPTSRRSKAPLRWAIIMASGLATAAFFTTILNGPAPTHASPPPTPVVLQQAPTMDELLNQEANASEDDGGAAFSAPSVGSQPRFRTRGS